MSFNLKKNTTPGLISLPNLAISVILGLCAFLLILSDIQINLPGTNLLTDPREIFVVISAAITGPVGGILSGALSSMYDPNSDLIVYIIAQHILAALWVSFSYKYLLFRKYSIPKFIGGWIFIILVYYYVCYIPIYVLIYWFFPKIYFIVNNGNPPLWSSLWQHYKGWSYEIIFTTGFSLLVMLALPIRLCIPRWGNKKQTEINENENIYFDNFIKRIPFLNRIGLRVFAVFLLLSIIPLVGVGIFIRGDVTKSLLEQEALHMYSSANNIAGLLAGEKQADYPLILSKFATRDDHFFITDSNGECKLHVKERKIDSSYCSFLKKDILFYILSNKDGTYIDGIVNKSYGFTDIKGTNLIIVFHSNEKNIFNKMPQLQAGSINKLSFSFLLIYFISGFVIWLVIARPIKIFKKVAQNITNGNYTQKVDANELDDELNDLAISFNQMTESLLRGNEELKERDFLLNIVVTNTPVIHFIIDSGGIFRLSIGKGLEALGLYENQVVGLSVYDVYKDFPVILKLVEDGYKGEKSSALLDVNGKYFDTTVIPTFNSERKIDSLIGIATDVTETIINERLIIESEHKFRLLAENSTDVISRFSKEGIILYMSPQCYNLTGYLPEEMLNDSILKYVYEADHNLLRANISETFKGGKDISRVSFRLIRKDGKLVWVETTYKLVSFKDGASEIQASTRDITERKKSEEEIRKLLLAVEQSPVMILITDTNGIIEYINPIFTHITGYSYDEIVGKTPAILKSGFTPENQYKKLWETISAGENWNGEIMNRKKNGMFYWESVLIAPIKDEFNNIKYFLGVKEDITERKNMEQELRSALDRAEESDTLKTNLLANMSHELRTPMNGILGFSSILLESGCTQKQADMISKIIISGKRLMTTLNSVLDLTQIEAGIVQPKYKDISLNTCVVNCVSPHQTRAKEKNLSFELLLPEYDIMCRLDEHIFNQILSYILDNAVKFTFEGGIKVVVGEEEKDGILKCFVKVKDTGIGIAQDHMELIFQEFKQVSEGYNRSFEGLGLGLTNANKLTALINGEITLESRLHSGSIFTLYFISENKHGIAERNIAGKDFQKPDHSSIITGASILIVEDNEMNVAVMKNFLSAYKIDTSYTGPNAINKAAANSYSLILMDINLLKGMTGIEAMKEIRKNKRYEQIPIIAVTGFAMIGDKEKLISEGFNDYLAKPFTDKELQNIVKKHL